MESHDVALIEANLTVDPHLAALWKEHLDFERQLGKLEHKPFLTPEEQLRRNALKKLKLAGRDALEQALAQYRAQQNGSR